MRSDTYRYYGMDVPKLMHPLVREMEFIQHGGQWRHPRHKNLYGNGMLFHFLKAIEICWPHIDQHRWFTLFVEQWLTHDYVGVMGPKSSGKTLAAAVCHLLWYYCFPMETTVIVCSDTKENLEDRIWGEIKKLNRMASEQYDWLPGHLIEGRTRLVTDSRDLAAEGRDMRAGMVGIPIKKGNQYVGISALVGRKNKYVFLCGDELSLLTKAFIDGIASLTANRHFKITGMGNPAQTTDALGVFCEPAPELGGWDGGIDQTPVTKTWATRFPKGICIQYPGSDSPNNDFPGTGVLKYPYLIDKRRMEEDAKIWGSEDWRYLMFDEGRMPRGVGARRVITRQLCVQHHALDAPVWLNTNLTYILCLDAAYRAVGGDRCVLMRLAFGKECESKDGTGLVESLINQRYTEDEHRNIIALLDTLIIPIKDNFGSPEDQIVIFTKQKAEAWGITANNFYFDAGMRTSLVSTFAQLWSAHVNTLDFGGKPSDRKVSADIDVTCKDYYSKRVTEIWFNWRLAIQADQVRGLTDDVVQEGCIREWKTVSGNKIEVETKHEMKSKSSRSPDLADCFCIGLYGAIDKGFTIRRLSADSETVGDNRWKRDLRNRVKAFAAAHSLNYSV